MGSEKVLKRKVRKKSTKRKSGTATKILRRRPIRIPKKFDKGSRGVVYLSHVPHGFYDQEMKEFFSQFGKVTGVRIPRSKKTGRFRGYGFVEFLYPDVAKIAAETMNNHLMFKRVVKAKYLPPSEQKPYAFRYAKFKVPISVRRKRVLRKLTNRELTESECVKEKQKLDAAVQNKLKKLKKLGINYEFQVYKNDGDEKQASMS